MDSPRPLDSALAPPRTLQGPRAALTRDGRPRPPAAHAALFRGGGAFLLTEPAWLRARGRGWFGRLDGVFLTSRSAMDHLLWSTGGVLALINARLGTHFTDGALLYRVDVRHPLAHNPRLPSGCEAGANRWFVGGGYTCGGLPELVTDPLPVDRLWCRVRQVRVHGTPENARTRSPLESRAPCRRPVGPWRPPQLATKRTE